MSRRLKSVLSNNNNSNNDNNNNNSNNDNNNSNDNNTNNDNNSNNDNKNNKNNNSSSNNNNNDNDNCYRTSTDFCCCFASEKQLFLFLLRPRPKYLTSQLLTRDQISVRATKNVSVNDCRLVHKSIRLSVSCPHFQIIWKPTGYLSFVSNCMDFLVKYFTVAG